MIGQSNLESVAKHLQRSAKVRHLFFAGLTLFAVLFTGYHLGTFDQVIHIPYLQKFAYHEKSLSPFCFYWLLSATIVTIFPVVILPLWGVTHVLPTPTQRQKIALVIMLVVIALGSYGTAIHEGIWGRGSTSISIRWIQHDPKQSDTKLHFTPGTNVSLPNKQAL